MDFFAPPFLLGMPLAFLLYWLLPVRLRPTVLLVASLVLYAVVAGWEGFAVLLAVASLAFLAVQLDWRWLAVGSLLPLLYYKYASGWGQGVAALAMPIGLSFYTFQSLGYAWGSQPGQSAVVFSRFLLYISFFPQIVAGPIVAPAFLQKMRHFLVAQWREARFRRALLLLALGYSKKILADELAGIADPVFSGPQLHSGGRIALGLVAFSLQIYIDFSGYSDLALGTACLFGFRLPENFRFPYHARSLREFWQRWHMTLGAFLKRFVYWPLGGSRHSRKREAVAIAITFLLGGLWHGAGWPFLLWGAGHAFFLVLERLAGWAVQKIGWPGFDPQTHPFTIVGRAALPVLGRIWTLAVVVLLWLPFRAGQEGKGQLAAFSALWLPQGWSDGIPDSHWKLVLFVLLVVAFSPGLYRYGLVFLRRHRVAFYPMALMAVLCALSLQQSRPFLYFVF